MGVSFAVMATLLTQLVSGRLFEQRTRQDSLSVERLAAMAAPFFASAQMDELQALLSDTAQPEFIFTKWKVGYYFTDKD